MFMRCKLHFPFILVLNVGYALQVKGYGMHFLFEYTEIEMAYSQKLEQIIIYGVEKIILKI